MFYPTDTYGTLNPSPYAKTVETPNPEPLQPLPEVYKTLLF